MLSVGTVTKVGRDNPQCVECWILQFVWLGLPVCVNYVMSLILMDLQAG